ncbi:hypothetical protein AK88_00325 [Plasmodium fragile]|uniref:Uncharacterized protein n=1 Tax=Plasmodium fragile TaxID=5857 RepID=A0A0D9QS19_PLAFR|nr:uncharacterized protein AK88_00325 [Plasmodium fragile]KJP89869.1 hypothetical protein AK88_00325 [Plasmodium fragile]
MGFIINDDKKNEVIKTSHAEVNREEATSDTYVGESNNGKKNGEQCPGGNGPVPLSDGDTPGVEQPAVGSERKAFVDETEVSNRQGEQLLSHPLRLRQQPLSHPLRLKQSSLSPSVSSSNWVHPINVPLQQFSCDNGSEINPRVKQNKLEPNGEGGLAPEAVGKMVCAKGEVYAGVAAHIMGRVAARISGGVTGPLDVEAARRKHPRASDQMPSSSANAEDPDESNNVIRKKIKKKVNENDQLFYAINEFMKEGLRNECIPLFERLQQNLFFLVMLANIPNDNFDELDSSSSDY